MITHISCFTMWIITDKTLHIKYYGFCLLMEGLVNSYGIRWCGCEFGQLVFVADFQTE